MTSSSTKSPFKPASTTSATSATSAVAPAARAAPTAPTESKTVLPPPSNSETKSNNDDEDDDDDDIDDDDDDDVSDSSNSSDNDSEASSSDSEDEGKNDDGDGGDEGAGSKKKNTAKDGKKGKDSQKDKKKSLVQSSVIPGKAALTSSKKGATSSSSTASPVDESDDGSPLGTPRYRPVEDAGWKKGEKVPYAAMARMFAKCELTTKRLKIVAYVSDFLRSVIALSPEQLLPAVYLCVNQIAPSYEGKELGIGDQTMFRALCEATGSTLQAIKDKYNECGDLGLIAEQSRAKQRTLFTPNKLTIPGVFAKLREIGNAAGSTQKKDIIKGLLVSCQGPEARFVARALQGNLRIHLALLTVLRALARAVLLTPPTYPPAPSATQPGRYNEEDCIEDDADSDVDDDGMPKKPKSSNRDPRELEIDKAHKRLEAAYNEGPVLERLVEALLTCPISKLHTRCFLTPGVPIKVMLGRPATSYEEALTRFVGAPFTLEYKYDGERAQIHFLEDGTYKIFSRHLEDNTNKYPDVIRKIPQATAPGVTSYIMDAEVVAWDMTHHKILPFQTLSTRKRKDVKEEDVVVQVCIFGFDLLYLNGKSYMKSTFQERRALLRANFNEVEGVFGFAKSMDAPEGKDVETMVGDIQLFCMKAVEDSCEGLMVKPLVRNARYVPDKRKWIKLKKDYLKGLGDTLDLVPLGAWYGKGKRTGTFGSFLMFAYDDSEDADGIFQSITKVGTGFSDEDLETLSAKLRPHIISGPRRDYMRSDDPQHVPDVWFSPAAVWELTCADLSISPKHKAAIGLVDDNKGIAMRFPRFIREHPDKQPENATKAEQVVQMYYSQAVVKKGGGGGANNEGDD